MLFYRSNICLIEGFVQFQRFDLSRCHEATGTAVVIDVLRAFTTAAFAFGRGAESISLVAEVAEAFQQKEENPSLILLGEVDGLPVTGFDYGNSPTAMQTAVLAGKRLVQRTSSGTQGVVRCTAVDEIVTASFVCARAVADYLRKQKPALVSFIITGAQPDRPCAEDEACADYLEALLTNQEPDPTLFLQRVRESANGRLFARDHHPAFPATDLDCAVALNQFDFVMKVQRQDGWHIMRAHRG